MYQYEKAELLRKTRTTQTLIFKGRWDVKNNIEISYLLGADSNSAITFKAALSVFEKNYIKYQIAITFSGGKQSVERLIALNGVWKINQNTGLEFEIKYGDGSLRSIAFGASVRLSGRDTLSLKLRNNLKNMDMGVELELSHKILEGEGEAFLRFIKDKQEVALLAGAGWRW